MRKNLQSKGAKRRHQERARRAAKRRAELKAVYKTEARTDQLAREAINKVMVQYRRGLKAPEPQTPVTTSAESVQPKGDE